LTRAASDSRAAADSSGGVFEPHPNAKVRTTPTSQWRSVPIAPTPANKFSVKENFSGVPGEQTPAYRKVPVTSTKKKNAVESRG
jgi:hypothetical protein